jgi:3-oxoacyl-[acyl-carrier protein] reductase
VAARGSRPKGQNRARLRRIVGARARERRGAGRGGRKRDVVRAPAGRRRAQDLERAVAQTLEAFRALDILVWNSGGPPPGTATDVTADSAEQAFELLLVPAIRLVRLCLPHLERSDAGRIVAITSLAAKEPTDHLALSNMLRPGLTGWLKTLAHELGPRGITVNCVAPGRIDTDRLAHLYPDGPTDEQLAEIPLRRWGTPREFGDVVCFLASDRARYVTGQTLVVDGGLQRFLF